MRSFILSFLLVSLLVLSGCASTAMVRIDRDPGADLASYKTFAFFDQLETDGGRYSSLLTEHLKTSTRAELERLGYVYDEHAPQLRVNFFLSVADRQEIRATPAPSLGWRFYGAWGGYDVHTEQYKAGTLSIDLVDVRRNSLVWEGVAEGKVRRETLDDPQTALRKIVSEMFSRFPTSPAA
jgi:uncharacterized protein DUF4136